MNKALKWLVIAAIALACVGIAAAGIGFAMDDTYPEEPPGWAFTLIWIGAAAAVVLAVVRGFIVGFRGQQ